MAVTIISSPAFDPDRPNSVSYPFIIEMNSDEYGGAGITQHRFKAEVNGSVSYGYIGDKYTVAYDDAGNGRFDFQEMLSDVILVLDYKDETAEDDLTKITDPQGLRFDELDACTIVIKEQYYDNGVFTENVADISLFLYGFARGFTDDSNRWWYARNWYQFNGSERFEPYSGYLPYLYYIDTHNPNYDDVTTYPYLAIKVTTYPGAVDHIWWILRDDYYGGTYFPIYFPGETDQADFERVDIDITVNSTPAYGPGEQPQERFSIYRTVTPCEDEEKLIMFRNRFNAWSFMSFSLKSYTAINTENQKATRVDEAEPPGRYRYNVEASDTLTLNTDWMTEEQNDLVRDLVETNLTFLVNSDGSLTHCVLQQNSLTLKTRRNDELFKYSMRFRLSVDNFRV